MSDSEETTSSTSEDDENAEEWTEDTEKIFLKTLSCLKSKDPKIYDDKVKFFQECSTKVKRASRDAKKDEQPPLFLRDYERKIILDKGGILTDDESEHVSKDRSARLPSSSRTYVEEQKCLRESFKQFLNCSDNDDDNNENDCGDFLKIKIKSFEEQVKEEEDYVKWLKGRQCELSDKNMESQLKYLRDYWTDPQLDESEQFLRDYVLNKRYLEASESDENDGKFAGEVPLSEEERMFDECERFEQEYNFRFEEPDKNFIKTYPRSIENSLRRREEKRKQKREMRKLKKQQQLMEKRLEVKQLKKLKKEEFHRRIEKLKEITGNSQFGFDVNDLEDDFNPDEYNKRMRELFNEEFYKRDDVDDTKPVFSDLDDGDWRDGGDDEFDESCENEATCVDVAFSDDTASAAQDIQLPVKYENDAPSTSRETTGMTRSSRRKGHKKSIFSESVAKTKPRFNETNKTFEQYVDEYYGLEFEDIVGDTPCRFKYRKVTPNSFGLSIEEILAADDKELNKWCSMQKVDTIRSEQNEKYDLKVYSRRGRDLNLKKKFLPSLFENITNEDVRDNENSLQNRMNEKTSGHFIKRKKHSKSQQQQQHQSNSKPLREKRKTGRHENHRHIHKKQKQFHYDLNRGEENEMKKPRHPRTTDLTSVSDERLKAYGINPKKFKNKIKYGSKE